VHVTEQPRELAVPREPRVAAVSNALVKGGKDGAHHARVHTRKDDPATHTSDLVQESGGAELACVKAVKRERGRVRVEDVPT
jgi:hypothetical protein